MGNIPSMITVKNQVVQLPTDEEKIKYCAKLIYETHDLLQSSSADLPRETKLRAMGVIRFAEKQLFQLIKK